VKKVVAFLEKYAEWVAMSLACVFLLYMVYAYVVSRDDLKVKVGSESHMPGDVDTSIEANAANPLKNALDEKSDISFPVNDFAGKFARAMGHDRDRMKPEFLAAVQFRPPLPGERGTINDPKITGIQISRLAIVPPPVPTGFGTGISMVADPAQLAAGGGAAQPNTPSIEKMWITWEGKFDTKALTAEWKQLFFDAKGNLLVPEGVLLTHFLRLEIERQEQIGPDQWGPSVAIAPLQLVEMKNYPAVGDRSAEEEYRLWAEKHQVDIVEPSFYQVTHGDPWSIPSLAPKEKEQVADATKEPFDPANPPNRPLTPEERQKVYIYNQKQKDEKQKADAASRKAKMDSSRTATPPTGGTTGGAGGGAAGGGRKRGGYAPLPEQYAADPTPRFDDGGRPIVPGARPVGGRRPIQPGREGNYREGGRNLNATPMINNGMVQNSALTQPFDPTKLLDGQGNPSDITIWAHDDTVVPGKTYRYHVRVSLKNPLYNSQGLAKDPAFETQLAITSPWSAWSEIKAPSNSEFFFSRTLQQINGKAISGVMVDVFKREKGDWYQGSFQISQGDGVGRLDSKSKIDFSTGATLVDIRPDVTGKDSRIMLADELGNVTVASFQAQLKDPLYESLKEKAKATAAAAPAASAGGNPALINEVTGR
jgi:hypothetical protein